MEAWLVTEENLDAVAAWCSGTVEGRDINRPEVAVPLEDDHYGRASDWAGPAYFVVDVERFERDYEEVG